MKSLQKEYLQVRSLKEEIGDEFLNGNKYKKENCGFWVHSINYYLLTMNLFLH